MPEVNLDKPASYQSLDFDDMLRRVTELPNQMEDAWQIAGTVDVPDGYANVNNIVIAGMGGSAIGGSLLESYAASDLRIPLQVWRGYGVPEFVDARSLVVGISYSGNTEETLSAVQESHERGARILLVTTGGQAGELGKEWGVPVLSFSYSAQPRATLGYLFTPLLRVFARLGFIPDQDGAYHEALEVARQANSLYGVEQPENNNEAKRLAEALHGKIAVIYGAEYLAAVARRWKTQLNENAKNWAFYEEFSELNHNAVVGYRFPSPDNILVVMLRGTHHSDRISIRMDVTGDLMDRYGVHWRTAQAEGEGRLAQMISLIALGDYVSYYLALLNGADPTEIEPIDYLKSQLAKHR